MTPEINQWAIRHGVGIQALHELQVIFRMHGPRPVPTAAGMSEAAVQAIIRLEAATKGVRLFRNNVGALPDQRGIPVRYGLANDSQKVNAVIKSGDLIGWRKVRIGYGHVGHDIAQFVSRECKARDWTYTGTERERAQLAWAQLVAADGGDASFAIGEGTL